jgi:hypothetical protein
MSFWVPATIAVVANFTSKLIVVPGSPVALPTSIDATIGSGVDVTVGVLVIGGIVGVLLLVGVGEFFVGVTVAVAVAVPVGRPVGVAVAVAVPVGMPVGVSVAVAVPVGMPVAVNVAVEVGVPTASVGVLVAVAVPVGRPVGVSVAVAVAVPVGTPVGVSVAVSVSIGVAVAVSVSTGVAVSVGRISGVSVAVAVAARVGVSVGNSSGVSVAVAVAVPVGTPVGVSLGVAVAVAVPAATARHSPLEQVLSAVQSLKSSQLAPSLAGTQEPVSLSQVLQSPHGIGPRFWHWPVATLQKSSVHLLLSESGHSMNEPMQMVPRQMSLAVHSPNESVHGCSCFAGSGAQVPCNEQVPSQPS